ncbi:integrase core domain-containing protein [Chloroflexota bacterium]
MSVAYHLVLEQWMLDYNEARLHSVLGYKPPTPENA